MVNTSKWPLTVDGVRLDTLAYNISTRQGRDLVAPKVGGNIETDLRDGELWVPNKKVGPGRIVLDMWVGGTDADGVAPTDDYEKYRDNLDFLLRMFNVNHRLLDIRQQWNIAGTKIRQALCELSAQIQPEVATSSPYTSRLVVEFKILGGFWQDVAESNYDSAIGLLTNTDIPLPVFAPSTAPIRDAWVVLDGPATNPKLIDYRTGHYVQLNFAVPNGQQWVVGPDWTSKVGAGIAFTTGGTDKMDVTVFAGSHAPALFGITADPLGPQVRIEGTGFGANTRLRIRAKNKYL